MYFFAIYQNYAKLPLMDARSEITLRVYINCSSRSLELKKLDSRYPCFTFKDVYLVKPQLATVLLVINSCVHFWFD